MPNPKKLQKALKFDKMNEFGGVKIPVFKREVGRCETLNKDFEGCRVSG